MGKKKKKDDLPEGMTRRQAKLAARAAERAALEKDPRPFGGLKAETVLIGMQHFIPAATAQIEVKGEKVTLCTILPGAVAGLVRDNGERMVALQSRMVSQNPGRDLAYRLEWVVDAAPGATLETGLADGNQPALTDIFPAGEIELTIHSDFNWWLAEGAAVDQGTKQLIEQANNAMTPTHQIDLPVTGSVFWFDAGDKAYIRWVRPDDEETLLRSLARAAAADKLSLGEDTKFAGVFRTDGVLVPVWDLDPTITHLEYDEQLEAIEKFLVADATNDAELTGDERRKLENIKSRQVTI
ncbi:MAG: DUF5926 family protein [Corynebacterium sp.]|nr:DUF5926 family protein [Corynebacterium sp.]